MNIVFSKTSHDQPQRARRSQRVLVNALCPLSTDIKKNKQRTSTNSLRTHAAEFVLVRMSSVFFSNCIYEPGCDSHNNGSMRTGTGDMIRRCRDVGLDEPEFALTDGFVVTIRRKPGLAFKAVGGLTGEVTGEVQRLLLVMAGEMKRTDIQEALALRHEDYFREAYLIPALASGMIEMTIPDKPRSSKQKYRLTEKGEQLVTKKKEQQGEE